MQVEKDDEGNDKRNCLKIIREGSIQNFQPFNPIYRPIEVDEEPININFSCLGNIINMNNEKKDKAKIDANLEKKDEKDKGITFGLVESNKTKEIIKEEEKSIPLNRTNVDGNVYQTQVLQKPNENKIRKVDTIDISMITEDSKAKTKEKISKKIRRVIEKVNEWRRLSRNLYMGKDSKEEASKRIGIKKKSLDDYLMYLRLGIVMSYDFAGNLDNKFGHLKKYINEYRKNQKWVKTRHLDVDSLEKLIQ